MAEHTTTWEKKRIQYYRWQSTQQLGRNRGYNTTHGRAHNLGEEEDTILQMAEHTTTWEKKRTQYYRWQSTQQLGRNRGYNTTDGRAHNNLGERFKWCLLFHDLHNKWGVIFSSQLVEKIKQTLVTSKDWRIRNNILTLFDLTHSLDTVFSHHGDAVTENSSYLLQH